MTLDRLKEHAMNRFDGQNVVITGAAQGMGKAIAEAFAREGARLLLADLNEAGAQAVAKELSGVGVGCDVTKADQVQAMIERGIAELGSIDILVNNAGTITMHPVIELTEDDWDLVMDVNA